MSCLCRPVCGLRRQNSIINTQMWMCAWWTCDLIVSVLKIGVDFIPRRSACLLKTPLCPSKHPLTLVTGWVLLPLLFSCCPLLSYKIVITEVKNFADALFGVFEKVSTKSSCWMCALNSTSSVVLPQHPTITARLHSHISPHSWFNIAYARTEISLLAVSILLLLPGWFVGIYPQFRIS